MLNNTSETVAKRRSPYQLPMLKESPDTFAVRRNLYQARLMFWLFIASLSMFFAACIGLYLLLIYGLRHPPEGAVDPVPYNPLEMPSSFVPSTLLLLLTGVLLHIASRQVAVERQKKFLLLVRSALYLSVLFLIVQGIALATLLTQHYDMADQYGINRMNGVCFAFALIHGLHVVGGVGYIGYVDYFGRQGKFDHEQHWAVDHCAWYWHFLDVVWLAMMATFWLTQ